MQIPGEKAQVRSNPSTDKRFFSHKIPFILGIIICIIICIIIFTYYHLAFDISTSHECKNCSICLSGSCTSNYN